MRVIKSEWHQVEKRYALDIGIDDIAEVYPENTDEENQAVLDKLASGEMTWEEFEEAADEEGAYYDWEWLDEDDWWTDRKGGYEITYEIDSND
jgi:hypothetical protein